VDLYYYGLLKGSLIPNVAKEVANFSKVFALFDFYYFFIAIKG
jgi:hypothetical protein